MLVDDHRMVAESMVRVLDAQEDMEVVLIAASVDEAVRGARDTSPDLVLMDYRLPDGDGVDATRRMCAETPGLRVLILTGQAEPAVLRDAIAAGGCGLVSKTAPTSDLVAAVRLAVAGATVAPEPLLRRALGPSVPALQLSQRELDVLQLLAAGFSNPRMAEELALSLNTIRNHVQHVLTKLGAHSKHEAVAIAQRQGLLRPS